MKYESMLGAGWSAQRPRYLWWRAALGKYAISAVTPAVLVQCRDNLQTQLNAAGVRGYFAALSHAFTIAIKEWQWCTVNPCLSVRRPPEPQGRIRFLSEEEIGHLLDACKTEDPDLYAVVKIALCTGMRRAEILGLTWDRVDFNRAAILLTETKNKQVRSIPLSPAVLDLLSLRAKVRRIDTALVFPARSVGKLHKVAPLVIEKHWQNAKRSAGLDDFRFHDLRHTAASYLAMSGASLLEIAEVLGHRTLQMVRRYAHLSSEHTASVVARMNQRLFGV